MITCALALLILVGHELTAQTTVNSLAALKPYLDDDNVNIKLSPGIYTIDAGDISSGAWGYSVPNFSGYARTVMLFSGDNSTYDFTGVTLRIDTDVLQAFGSVQVWQLQITGSHNVLKNLTMIDYGSEDDRPSRGACNIVMDGEDNRVEGFNMTITGSYPYGYGDAFGKGGSYTIQHFKHSALLVRGESNHVLNCNLTHRSYGHAIFMQAASNPTIEGCYVEGEVRTTDDMLAETSGPAYDIDFMTDWGYRLPAGYMMSLGEEGIRAYNAGETVVNGNYIERGTSNPTVLNCTVKRMRGGVTLPHASGTVYVEGCTVRECQGGYQLAGGSVINSSADCVYGPVYKSAYDNDDPTTLDISVLPAEVPYYNGSKCVAYLGNDHGDVTLTGSEGSVDQNLKIMLGGYFDGVGLKNGNASSQNNHTGYYLDLNNLTNYPVVIPSGANNNTVVSCGVVTNGGSGNSISSSSNCPTGGSCGEFNPYSVVQAEDFCDQFGVQVESNGQSTDNVGFIQNGDWISFDDVDFGAGALLFEVDASSSTSGGAIELRLGGTAGTLIGTCNVTGTGSWNSWNTFSSNISGASGTQDLYLVFTGGSGYLFNLDHFQFTVGNIAFGKYATQSSTDHGGIASRAIDGNTSGIWSQGSVTHTVNESNPWWEVDLGGRYDIDEIIIYNRTNCCMDRLSNFTVSIRDGSTTTFSQFNSNYPNPSISLDAGGATGSIVRVQLNGTNPLSLAEVEVFGTANTGGQISNVALSKPVTVTAYQTGNPGSNLVDDDPDTRWSASGYSQAATIDLGAEYNISSTEVICYGDRAYQFTIESSVDGNSYSTIVDRSSNTTPGTNSLPITDNFSSTNARYIRMTVTGASAYSGSWVSIEEIRVFGIAASARNLNRLQGESMELNQVQPVVYPNPANHALKVSLANSQFDKFLIYNIDGKVVQNGNIEPEISSLSIDLTGIKRGIYMLSLIGSSSYTYKFIRQ